MFIVFKGFVHKSHPIQRAMEYERCLATIYCKQLTKNTTTISPMRCVIRYVLLVVIRFAA